MKSGIFNKFIRIIGFIGLTALYIYFCYIGEWEKYIVLLCIVLLLAGNNARYFIKDYRSKHGKSATGAPNQQYRKFYYIAASVNMALALILVVLRVALRFTRGIDVAAITLLMQYNLLIILDAAIG